jgi:hypothetical protein
MSFNSNSIITREDAENNFKEHCAQLAAARDFFELYQIKNIVINIQKNGGNGAFYFPKGKSKEFWAMYQTRKSEIVAHLAEKKKVFDSLAA